MHNWYGQDSWGILQTEDTRGSRLKVEMSPIESCNSYEEGHSI